MTNYKKKYIYINMNVGGINNNNINRKNEINLVKNINYFKSHLTTELLIFLTSTLIIIYWRSIWLLLDNITDIENNKIHLLFIITSYVGLILIHKENFLI